MIQQNRLDPNQRAILAYLESVGGGAKFETIYELFKARSPKFKRIQLAAMVLPMHYAGKVVWNSPEGIKLIEDYLDRRRT